MIVLHRGLLRSLPHRRLFAWKRHYYRQSNRNNMKPLGYYTTETWHTNPKPDSVNPLITYLLRMGIHIRLCKAKLLRTVCLSVCLYVLPLDITQRWTEARVKKFGIHANVGNLWSWIDFGFERSNVKVAGLESGLIRKSKATCYRWHYCSLLVRLKMGILAHSGVWILSTLWIIKCTWTFFVIFSTKLTRVPKFGNSYPE